jgi:hypothetical protein
MHLIENISCVRLKQYYYLDWVDANSTAKISHGAPPAKQICKTKNIIPNSKNILQPIIIKHQQMHYYVLCLF